MAKIVSITKVKTPDYVYDPVCPAPHAYISDGFVSHNCDEIDKGLGGIGGGGNDGGTSSRVLGSFLTWLQENKTPVFTMVTANNIDGLPPELLRRGRFDAIFSTGLPTAEEREQVLAIHLRKRNRDIASFPKTTVKRVVDASAGYVPAEIESAVKDGLIDAFSAGEKFTLHHVVNALEVMVPLSHAFNERIQIMTAWAKQNATPAGKVIEDVPSNDEPPPATPRRRMSIVKK